MMGDINQALANSEAVVVDHDMLHMIKEIKAIHAASHGTFNPAIGKIVARWGFPGRNHAAWQPPESENIEKVLSASFVASATRTS
jgi:thiamine biosynthesis lipoprotein